jgi:NTP pyrophosphatase (non-canonical NTP hydrolase)
VEVERMKPRPVVKWFAEQMERKLRDNDHKCGWNYEMLEFLSDKLGEECSEVQEALKKYLSEDSPIPIDDLDFAKVLELTHEQRKEIIDEAADLANIAMMLADICK